MAAKTETWCDRDEHDLFEYFNDFNEWLDSVEGIRPDRNSKQEGLKSHIAAYRKITIAIPPSPHIPENQNELTPQ